MFTGIVEAVGKVLKYDANRLSLRMPFRAVRLGESISIDGVCLTVARKAGPVLFFDVGPETRRVTTLGTLRPDSHVNLERALRAGDRLGGHWVTGHVEALGRIVKIESAGRNRWFYIRLPRAAARFVAVRGSLTVDGISLTVAGLARNTVKLMLIPHTLSHTTLGNKKAGDAVNIETDLLAKYAAKQRKIPYVIRQHS